MEVTMILTAIAGLMGSLLYEVVIFLIGKILSQPIELRLFLGLNTPEEDLSRFSKTTELVEIMGKIVMFIAVVGALTSIITTMLVFLRL